MTRHEEREITFRIIFQYEFDHEKSFLDHYEFAKETREDIVESPYCREVLTNLPEHLDFIDSRITLYSQNWAKTRISKVSLAILRLAGYEIYFRKDVPLRVSLNEAIELSKSYDLEKAYVFVNGVLNAMIHDPEAQEEPQKK